ncbi:DUF1413 domain-containing protein [Histidinibacterium aquaticum]|uniref:DUF1413 domain-containing protein n=1 Tax=Histidinibacterium aquaticum TaxID=2613962 RepID=A0A5J5GFS7_9RHOB|nr:DUF1413 domain-containing protein [Histidinibacterium aquaticum]KAA9006981.1 DUF1413 domain-containing protein [Histidinibacterium aquaticum]
MDERTIERLRRVLAGRAAGEFHFPEVYGPEWERLPIGEKVKLGHRFLDLVREGTFRGVSDTGRKAGGGRVYRKAGTR